MIIDFFFTQILLHPIHSHSAIYRCSHKNLSNYSKICQMPQQHSHWGSEGITNICYNLITLSCLYSSIKVLMFEIWDRQFKEFQCNGPWDNAAPTTVMLEADLQRRQSTGFMTHLNTLRPRQNGGLLTDDTFKCIFLNENNRILVRRQAIIWTNDG